MSLLSCSRLGVAIGGKTILSEVSLTIDVGAVTAVVGPNGAGKSTLLSCLAGLRRRLRGRSCWTTRSCRR